LRFGFTDWFPEASHAMRKTLRRRPEVETLESLPLLSGIAAAPGPLQLAGSLRGSASTQGSPTFHATGTLGAVGDVTAAGHGSIETVTGPNGSFSFLTKRGRIFVATDVAPTGRRSFSGDYTIQGGSASYAGETGTGLFAVTYHGSKFQATFR
jgi:hypothetical protein